MADFPNPKKPQNPSNPERIVGGEAVYEEDSIDHKNFNPHNKVIMLCNYCNKINDYRSKMLYLGRPE